MNHAIKEKLLDLFLAAPQNTLTTAEIIAAFDTNRKSANDWLREMQSSGEVQFIKNGVYQYVVSPEWAERAMKMLAQFNLTVEELDNWNVITPKVQRCTTHIEYDADGNVTEEFFPDDVREKLQSGAIRAVDTYTHEFPHSKIVVTEYE